MNSKFGKNNENNLTFENKRCILKINSINGRWIKMFNLEELSLEFVEISELKTSKNLFGPVMYVRNRCENVVCRKDLLYVKRNIE